MCIAYLALGDPDWPLLIAANRDEYHARPTAAAAPWADRPDIIGGLDLHAGGTWLGRSRAGRYALLTNYREPGRHRSGAPSRGALVRDFLLGTDSAAAYAEAVCARGADYNGFNLIIGAADGVRYLGNRDPSGRARPLTPGRPYQWRPWARSSTQGVALSGARPRPRAGGCAATATAGRLAES